MSDNLSDLILTHGDNITLPVANLSNTSLSYLLQYGFTQSLQDAVAGVAKATKDAIANDRAAAVKAIDGATTDMTDERLVEIAVANKTAARLTAIREGTVGTRRVGPRKTGVESIAWDIAVDEIKALAAKAGKKLPAKAADFNPMVEKYLTKHGDRIGKLATKRLAELNRATDSAADDLAELGL